MKSFLQNHRSDGKKKGTYQKMTFPSIYPATKEERLKANKHVQLHGNANENNKQYFVFHMTDGQIF